MNAATLVLIFDRTFKLAFSDFVTPFFCACLVSGRFKDYGGSCCYQAVITEFFV